MLMKSKVERRGFIACLVGLLCWPFAPKRESVVLSFDLQQFSPALQKMVAGLSQPFVAGADLEPGHFVYLAADGRVYPHSVIARTNLGESINGIASGPVKEGEIADIVVSGGTKNG